MSLLFHCLQQTIYVVKICLNILNYLFTYKFCPLVYTPRLPTISKYGVCKHTLTLYMKYVASITKEREKNLGATKKKKNPRLESSSDNIYLKTHTEKFAYTSFSRDKSHSF